MNNRITDELRALCGVSGGVKYNSFDEYPINRGRVAEECDKIDKQFEELEKRLMPEGMELPRYEDDDTVRIGDEVIDHNGLLCKVKAIVITGDGYSLVNSSGKHFFRYSGGRVKRPTTKVIAADGKPLEVGQTVWHIDNGREFYVYDVDSKWGIGVSWRDGEVESTGSISPNKLTHQRPVLDADGVPIKIGDTVWIDGEPEYSWTVTYVNECRVGGYCNEDGCRLDIHPKSLTHTEPEPPDSWERIEEDARKMVDDGLHDNDEWVIDIVGRCKKLAGVE